jgi:transcriptional regulator with XRE-family HTH domain
MAHFNKKVARNRGPGWVEALRYGKIASRLNPSLLAERRTLRGLRQIDVAARLQMSLTSYCAVERGHRLVKEFIAKHIASELGLRVADLFEPSEEMAGKYRAILRNPDIKIPKVQAISKLVLPAKERVEKAKKAKKKAKVKKAAPKKTTGKEKKDAHGKTARPRVPSTSSRGSKTHRVRGLSKQGKKSG